MEVGIEIGLVYGELVSRSMDNARRRPVRTLPLKSGIAAYELVDRVGSSASHHITLEKAAARVRNRVKEGSPVPL